MDWALHNVNTQYGARLHTMTLPDEASRQEEHLMHYMPFIDRMANMTYWRNASDVQNGLSDLTHWRLVGYSAFSNSRTFDGRADIDTVFVAQHQEELECVIVFEGSYNL